MTGFSNQISSKNWNEEGIIRTSEKWLHGNVVFGGQFQVYCKTIKYSLFNYTYHTPRTYTNTVDTEVSQFF